VAFLNDSKISDQSFADASNCFVYELRLVRRIQTGASSCSMGEFAKRAKGRSAA